MPSNSRRDLLIPWSQAQQLRLAAVFDGLLDGCSRICTEPSLSNRSAAWNRTDGEWFSRELPNTVHTVCADHRMLATAACVVAQNDIEVMGVASHVSPVSVEKSGVMLPFETRRVRQIRRAWLGGLWRVLSGDAQTNAPAADAFDDVLDQDQFGGVPSALSRPFLISDPWDSLIQCWEHLASIPDRPQQVTLLVSAGDEADPRYDSLQRSLLRRIELILHSCDIEERIEQEKLASLKRLAYGASHEINNPLANIATRAQTLMRDESNVQRRQVLEMINAQAFRAFDMMANLMHYAAPPLAKLQSTDLVALTRRCMSDVRAHWAGALEPQWRGGQEPIEARVDVSQIALMIQAILRNAWEACGPTGTVSVSVEKIAVSEKNGDWVSIRISDDGPMVPPESIALMCDPFHSGREAGRGLGFGLAKSLRIVEAHHGWLALEPRQPHGMQVTVYLPR